ncbi:acetyl-CoA carboxylase biotin carboxyl carrier protein [Algoriphagus halophytocola]|uniref:Biotin carboxyl carrier protein of acetyl-CoA carboxylase n=1 Tax=Algoriphagus halophytocola TaxID=2991499 RepID=A0ABY6MHR1_9BACT|nr:MULTISPECIES: acetyl-CoA carboxylase biotin carboxyl carrier protein [unclassified Algoriphagus]UZD23333.1 acetyl-CoA carboxylase biotin carboxyl carrier protein [Algoriphagus sp. TR-M5]WBL44628.1 acetyl-CoA carboxylase biotin carboxyl carrier protein [Algoriphagus sp. TR-M9]
MKAKEIQELIDYISNSGLAEVKIKTDEFELSIKKDSPASKVVEAAPAPAPAAAAAPAPAAAPNPAPAPAPEAAASSNLVEIKSPMIGTFYMTANPDADPFVTEGDSIKAGQTVCIIEAMKLFNEIESEISGKIVKVLVSNSTPVEYDQPLFLVDPAG